jgi:ubiquinone/menaquinone biosynthesis C-methylase UbiE
MRQRSGMSLDCLRAGGGRQSGNLGTGDTRRHFAALAPSYARLRGGDFSPLTAALVREADLAGRKVLDVGCGTGRLLRELVDRYRVKPVGLDRSSEMIREARRLLGRAAELHVGAAEAMPVSSASVERAVMTMVAHHLDRPAAFREIHRVLTRGGLLAVASTDPEAVSGFWMAPLFSRSVEIDRQRFPTAQALLADLTAARFRATRVVPFEMERVFDRQTALAKLRGRAYSTFAFMSEDEYAEGLARAEQELPDTIAYTLRILIAVGARNGM